MDVGAGWGVLQRCCGVGHVTFGRCLGVITANAFVDLLCSRYSSKCLSYVGVFVI